MMNSKTFEAALRDAVMRNLREDMCADNYIDAVLDAMWDGEAYVDIDGDTYHEISGRYTNHGNPVVIS